MQTLYIDVYFLVNFVVDTLALYFAAKLTKLRTTIARLLLSGTLGALYAVLTVLVDLHVIFFFAIGALTLFLMCRLTSGACSLLRLCRAAFFFLMLEILIGGGVYFAYAQLDKLLGNLNIAENNGAENRKMLLFAVLILLSFGLLRLLFLIFSASSSERVVCVSFEVFHEKITFDALVDSGNLLKDPMSATPVLLLKAEGLRGKIPDALLSGELVNAPEEWRRLVRLIPVRGIGSQTVLVGIYLWDVSVSSKKGSARVPLIVAFDKEGGDYGGYRGLIPSAVLDDVL